MSFLDNIDTNKLEELSKQTKENSEYFWSLVNSISSEYTQDLDCIMRDLYKDVTGSDAISTDDAERYYAELTNLLYFKTTDLEKLNVYSDMAAAAAKEVYSKAYLSSASEKDEKGKSLRTVSENQSLADISAQYETVSSSVYQHVYKCVKSKYDSALEAVTMLKNIIKRRMNEEYLSGIAGTNKSSEFE